MELIIFITSCPHLEGMFGSDLELMLESPSWAGAGLGPGSPVALAGEAGVEPELSMEEEDCSTADIVMVPQHSFYQTCRECLTRLNFSHSCSKAMATFRTYLLCASL